MWVLLECLKDYFDYYLLIVYFNTKVQVVVISSGFTG